MPYQAELALQLSKLIMKKRGKGEKKQEKQQQLKAIESPLGNHLQWGAEKAHSSPVL